MTSQIKKKTGSWDSSGNSSEEEQVLVIKAPKAGSHIKTDSDADKYIRIKETAEKLLSEGKVPEAIECFNSMLNLIYKLHGPPSVEFNRLFIECIEELNKSAMKFVQMQNIEAGLKILNFCDEVTSSGKFGNFPFQKNQTFNNIGCIYRRIGKVKTALNYLKAALNILMNNNMMKFSAMTHLNLCAVLSQMGEQIQETQIMFSHVNASQNARNALIYAQEEILLYNRDVNYNPDKFKEKVTLLSIAYHNMGVEEEYLSRFEDALAWYEKSYRAMEEYGVIDEKLYEKFQSVHKQAQEKFINQITKKNPRPSSAGLRKKASFGEQSLKNISVMSNPIRPPSAEFKNKSQSQRTTATSFIIQNNQIKNRNPSSNFSVNLLTQNLLKRIIFRSPTRNVIQIGRKTAQSFSKPEGPQQSHHRRIVSVGGSSLLGSGAFSSLSGSPDARNAKAVPFNNFLESKDFGSSGRYPNQGRDVKDHSGEMEMSEVRSIASEDHELKLLEHKGILNWSESEDDGEKKKSKKKSSEHIKSKRMDFLASLQQMDNQPLNGHVKIIDSSEESSVERKIAKKSKSPKSKKTKSPQFSEKPRKSPIVAHLKSSDEFYSSQEFEGAKVYHRTFTPSSPKNHNAEENDARVISSSGDTMKRPRSPVAYTKEQILKRKKAAIKIQRFYRKKAAQERYHLMQQKKKSLQGKVLICRQMLALTPQKTIGDGTIDKEKQEFVLRAFAIPKTREIEFNLTNVFERTRYDTRISYAMIRLSYEGPGDRQLDELEALNLNENKALLQRLIDRTIPKFIVRDHLLLLDEDVTHDLEGKTSYVIQHELPDPEERQNKEDAERNDEPVEDQRVQEVKNSPKKILPRELILKVITKIQSHFRARLARQRTEILKLRKFIMIHMNTRIENDGNLILFRILKNKSTDEITIHALNCETHTNFEKFEVPKGVMEALKFNYEELIKKIEVDYQKNILYIDEDVLKMLDPVKRARFLRQYDIKKIIYIQAVFRRFIRKQYFNMLFQKLRKSDFNHFIKKWIVYSNEGVVYFYWAFFSHKTKSYVIKAGSTLKGVIIEPISIPITDIDRHDFKEDTANINKLLDMIKPHIFIKTFGDRYIVYFDKRQMEKSTRKLEQKIHSNITLENETSNSNPKERRNAVRNFVLEKMMNQGFQFKLKPTQGVSEKSRITEDPDLKMVDFGAKEKHAVDAIQRFYREKSMRRSITNRAEKKQDRINKDSYSEILARSIQGRAFSLFCKGYKRMTMPEEELRKESTDMRMYLKTIPRILFSATALEAKAHIWYDKTDANKKIIEVELIFPISGKLQKLQIDCFKISPHFKKEIFLKKIEELLIDNLDYDKETREVKFISDNKKLAKISANPLASAHIHSFIKAKLIRIRFLKRKVSTKDLLLLRSDTQRIEKLYVGLEYFWDRMKKVIKIIIQRLDEGMLYKEIVIKFTRINEKSPLKVLLYDGNISNEQFKLKMEPYLEYMTKLYKVVVEKNDPLGFKILMTEDGFTIEAANKREITVFLNDISLDLSHELINSNNVKHIEQILQKRKLAMNFVDALKIEQNAAEEEEAKKAAEEKKKKEEAKLNDSNAELEEEREVLFKQFNEEELLHAKEIVLKHFRGYYARRKYQIMKKRASANKKHLLLYGKLVKKTIRKIENNYYRISVYKREIEEADAISFFFDVYKLTDEDKKDKPAAKGYFKLERTMLINSNGKSMEDFLCDKLEISGTNIEFNILEEDQETFIPLNVDEKTLTPQKNEAQNQLLTIKDFPQERLLTPMRRIEEVGETEEDKPAYSFNPEEIKAGNEEVPKMSEEPTLEKHLFGGAELIDDFEESESDLVIKGPNKGKLRKEKKETKHDTSSESNSKIHNKDNFDEEIPTGLLQQRAEAVSDNLLLYNVFYNTQGAPLDMSPKKGEDPKHDELTKNVVKIDIDINELKKYAPISPKSQKDLQNIANEITKSIQVDQRGAIKINAMKLNPNAVSVIQKNVKISNFEEKKSEVKSENKKVLHKTTKIYGDRKFLLVINYIERLSNINKIIIAHEGDDQVYEEFELFIEVSAICLTQNSLKPISWEVPIQECQRLTGSQNVHEIAKFFSQNINIYGDKLLLSTPHKSLHTHKDVIIMSEKLITFLQNKYKTKKFLRNFNKHKDQLKELQNKIIARSVVILNHETYHVYGYEVDDLYLQIDAWEMSNYIKYELVLDKNPLSRFLGIDKASTLRNIFKYLTLEYGKTKKIELVLKEKPLIEHLNKEFMY